MLVNNTQYYRIMVSDVHDGEAVSDWLRLVATRPVLEWPGVFHQTEKEVCICVETDPPHSRKWFGKFFSRRGLSGFFPVFFCGSKALRAYKISESLHRRGYPTPRPVGIASFKSGPNRGHVLLLTHWIEEAVPLGPFIDEFILHRHEVGWLKKKRQLISLVAGLLSNLHEGGIYHGDLTMNNIVLRPNMLTSELFIIDTADIRSTHRISRRRKEKNLTEVNRFVLDMTTISKADRYRFLQIYLDEYSPRSKIVRDLWKRIEIQSQNLLKHQNRKFYYNQCVTSKSDSLAVQREGRSNV